MIKQKMNIIFAVIFCVFSLSSCYTAQPIVKLQPDDSKVRWENGTAYISDSIYGVKYEVAYIGIQDSQYVFDFHIINHSNKEYVVDPSSFYYRPCDELLHEKGLLKVTAIDPEKELSRINKGLSQTQIRRKNNFGIALFAIGADIISSIVMSNDYNPHDHFVRDAVSSGVQTAVYVSSIANEEKADNLKYEKQKYSNSVIRKTTLDCNYAVYGKVFFPVTANSEYIRLYVPVDNDLIVFTFKKIQK